ncbi:ABC transporter substrate-binding protein [Jiangella alba]|uniref:Peptide/nickel transport system substrate-binding protein n=1 Tax=Jiangella alba TaxID=561176 RepID=A0A1H5PYE9_9ACTN|nr:ABC transporter substrate-binding protein [Jiangella alba]SEF18892.1 peptide/nickel transport system substrate-binding protein [Jiangella alba]
MTPRSNPTRLALGSAALVLAAVVAVSCSTAPPPLESGSGGDGQDADVADLVPVEPFELITTTTADNPQRFEVGRLIAEAWSEAGIPVELATYSPDEMTRRAFTSKEFDTYLIEYVMNVDRLDPNDFLSRFYSGNAGADGSNLSGYQDPEFDQLYEDQLAAADDAERGELVDRAQAKLAADVPIGLVLHPTNVGPYNARDWSDAVDAAEAPAYNLWSLLEMEPTGERRTLVVAVIAGATTLNPVAATDVGDKLPVSYLYDTLVRIGPDGGPQPWAAESVETDGATVRARLREGMLFHDGTPVTAADVKFTFDYLVQHAAPAYAARLAQLESVQVDGDTVVFQLAEQSAAFESVVLSTVPILPRHVWEPITDPLGYDNAAPIGSGPFAFESFRRDSALRLTANADHFRAPRADGVVLAVYGNRDAMIGALETGDADLVSVPLTTSQAGRFDGSSSVGLIERPGYGWIGVHYNMRKPPFDDVAMRRALTLALPSQDIIDIVYEGSAQPAGSVIAPSVRWGDPDVTPQPFDPDAARAELEAAGYVFDGDTLYYPPGAGGR